MPLPLCQAVLFRYAQLLFTHAHTTFQFLHKQPASPAVVPALQTSFVGVLLMPLLNSLVASSTSTAYLAELQALIDAVRAAFPLFTDAVESERVYAVQPSGLAPAAAALPATPPAGATHGSGINLATLAPKQVLAGVEGQVEGGDRALQVHTHTHPQPWRMGHDGGMGCPHSHTIPLGMVGEGGMASCTATGPCLGYA